MSTEIKIENQPFIYTKIENQGKFDRLQILIVEMFSLTSQYYDTKTALKMRLAFEHFLELHGNLYYQEIHRMRRTVEEPNGIIEQGVFSHIT